MKEMIATCKEVNKSYPLGDIQIQALTEINLSIYKETFTFIIGKSGSGKSTLLNLLGAIDTPSQGLIHINDMALSKFTDNQLSQFRGNTIGHIFQNFNLIPVLNLYENIEFPLLLQNQSKKQRHKVVSEYIEAVGLQDFTKHMPSELSGGQRQRVAIARALVKKPLLVLADEPTANLDSVTGSEIISLMLDMKKYYKTTFVFSTHDKEILSHADEIYTLKDGGLEEDDEK